MAGQNQSPPVQGFHSVSSSDYGSPPHLEPYSPSVVVTKQGGATLSSTSGPEVSTSGRHQATAQLEDRGRSPLIVGLGHPTALAPHTAQPVLPPTAEVDIPTITPSTGSISHHNYNSLHSCGRNAKYSSHITNQNSYTSGRTRKQNFYKVTHRILYSIKRSSFGQRTVE